MDFKLITISGSSRIACVASLLWILPSFRVVSIAIEGQTATADAQDDLIDKVARRNHGPLAELRRADWSKWRAILDPSQHAVLLEQLQASQLEYESALEKSAAQLRQDLSALDLETQARIEESVLARVQAVEPVNALDREARAARAQAIATIEAELEVTGIRYASLRAGFADAGRRYMALTSALRSVRALRTDDALLGEVIDSSISELHLRDALRGEDIHRDYERPIILNALLTSVCGRDACVAATLRDEGMSADGAPRDRSIPEDPVLRPILGRYWEQSVPRTIEWFAKLAKQSQMSADAETRADATAHGRAFLDSGYVQQYRQRHRLLLHACIRDLAEAIGAKCGATSRECFLVVLAQSVAGRIAQNPWLSSNRTSLMEALSLDDETRAVVDPLFDRFEAAARRGRAEFASKAMAIREILVDEYPDERAAARMHRASRRALWDPHETAIGELRVLLSDAQRAKFDAALARARLEEPYAFGDSPHSELDRVE